MSYKDIARNAPWHATCTLSEMALWPDTRFALRQLRKSPGFTLIVIGTLALCIGVNTAVFSVLDAVLLRSAPYPKPERLATVVTASRGGGVEDVDMSQTGGVLPRARHRSAGWPGVQPPGRRSRGCGSGHSE